MLPADWSIPTSHEPLPSNCHNERRNPQQTWQKDLLDDHTPDAQNTLSTTVVYKQDKFKSMAVADQEQTPISNSQHAL